MPSVMIEIVRHGEERADGERGSKTHADVNKNSKYPEREGERAFCGQFLSNQRADVIRLLKLETDIWKSFALGAP